MDTKTETKTLQHFIGGTWVDAEDGGVFDVLNPLDDSLYAHAAKGTSADMRAAVAASKAAFPAYRDTTPTQRERMLLRVAELMEERQKDLVDCLIDEIDKGILGATSLAAHPGVWDRARSDCSLGNESTDVGICIIDSEDGLDDSFIS